MNKFRNIRLGSSHIKHIGPSVTTVKTVQLNSKDGKYRETYNFRFVVATGGVRKRLSFSLTPPIWQKT